jgi:protein O-mannosyl-transferase
MQMFRPRIIALLLLLITLVIYFPVAGYDFSLFDDNDYVAKNPEVQKGLTWSGLRWAFTTGHASNWHPLTWISHMADCELFGLKPGAHHLVNSVFHAINAVLVLMLLSRLTKEFWPSAFAAALFAWHPLRVESVAWISERKDVLSMFFALLALLAYTHYAMRQSQTTHEKPDATEFLKSKMLSSDYALALFFFTLSLLAKPTAVTVPFVMLLLDYWPLCRNSNSSARPSSMFWRLVVEKWPFMVISAASCVITFVVQRAGGMVLSMEQVPFEVRLENVPVAYVNYLLKMIWPVHLAVLYQRSAPLSPLVVASAMALLILISAMVWCGRKRSVYWLVGWLWFLGALVPMIGLVPIGGITMADRYTYFPSIGIFLALALGLRDAALRFHFPKIIFGAMAGLILAGCLALTENQLRYWRDDVALFSHVIDVNGDTGFGHLRLGLALEQKGRDAGAMAEYRTALKLEPERAETHRTLANLLAKSGQLDEARAEYLAALEINPNYVSAHYNLALLLGKLGQPDEAMKHYLEVLQLDTNFTEAHINLGLLFAKNGQYDAAVKHYNEAARLDPANWFPYYLNGKVLLKQGRAKEAVESLQWSLQLAPENLYVLSYLAQVLASDDDPKIRDGRAAFALIQKAISLSQENQPVLLEVLAMAYAELGSFHEAQSVAQDALDLARNYEMTAHLPVLEQQLQSYKNKLPFRQTFTNSPLNEIPAK